MNLPRRAVTNIIRLILEHHEEWHGPIEDKDILIECLEDAVLQCAEFRRKNG